MIVESRRHDAVGFRSDKLVLFDGFVRPDRKRKSQHHGENQNARHDVSQFLLIKCMETDREPGIFIVSS